MAITIITIGKQYKHDKYYNTMAFHLFSILHNEHNNHWNSSHSFVLVSDGQK